MIYEKNFILWKKKIKNEEEYIKIHKFQENIDIVEVKKVKGSRMFNQS